MNTKLLILATILLIAGCGKRVEDAPATTTALPTDKVVVSGQTAYIFHACWNGLSFLHVGHRGGIVQVMDSTGKPLQC